MGIEADTFTQEQCDAVRRLDVELPPSSCPSRWLGKDASLAFLTCLGAGPWKIDRRLAVQRRAREWFLSHQYYDLRNVEIEEINAAFPLVWQKQLLAKMVQSLIYSGQYFKDFCREIVAIGEINPQAATDRFFFMLGTQKRTCKSAWLFVRDYLELPAFAIDRHVRRHLIDNGLPLNHDRMLALCKVVGTNPNNLARRMFATAATNPDWSSR
jgi:hypothetical protein